MSAERDHFWLVLHEPGCVPERKGPWPDCQLKAVLREFIAARPTAYVDVLTIDHDGPHVRHGPEVLQMADGRSMSVGRRHNASTSAAHAGSHITPGSAASGTVSDIPDDELLRRAVARKGHGRKEPRWARVMDRFLLGNTYAHQLCRRFGFDPDEKVGS